MKRFFVFLAVLALTLPLAAQKPADWKEPSNIRAILSNAGNDADLPRGLSHCLAYAESRFIPTARSRVVDGYRSDGLTQIYRKYIIQLVARFSSNPETFQWSDPGDNAEVGCRYLSYLIARFGGSVYLGVLAYNWGPTNVQNMKSLDEIPPHCKQYAENVLSLLDQWEEGW